MADTPHDSTGTTLFFPTTATSNAFTVTNLVFSVSDVQADDKIDISHLGLTTGAAQLTQDRPLAPPGNNSGREVQIEVIGKNTIADGATGTLTVSGGLVLSKAATVNQASLTLAVNDAIRGSITFRVAR
ncbi:MAG: hypothetical protein KGR24_07755 [Planctomycetes bacterium]|nr:hypothetical protein [Planctomycetota bacterium]